MVELEPWCIFFESGAAPVALWQPASTAQPALAMFSTADKAAAYAGTCGRSNYRITQLEELNLVRLLIELFSQGICFAALDPDPHEARSLFDLRQVLKSAKEKLRPSADRLI